MVLKEHEHHSLNVDVLSTMKLLVSPKTFFFGLAQSV